MPKTLWSILPDRSIKSEPIEDKENILQDCGPVKVEPTEFVNFSQETNQSQALFDITKEERKDSIKEEEDFNPVIKLEIFEESFSDHEESFSVLEPNNHNINKNAEKKKTQDQITTTIENKTEEVDYDIDFSLVQDINSDDLSCRIGTLELKRPKDRDTVEKAELKKLKARRRSRKCWEKMSDGQKETRRKKNREQIKVARENWTEGQKEVRRKQNREQIKEARNSWSDEQKEARKKQNREQIKRARANWTDAQKDARKKQNREQIKFARENWSEEQKEDKRKKNREHKKIIYKTTKCHDEDQDPEGILLHRHVDQDQDPEGILLHRKKNRDPEASRGFFLKLERLGEEASGEEEGTRSRGGFIVGQHDEATEVRNDGVDKDGPEVLQEGYTLEVALEFQDEKQAGIKEIVMEVDSHIPPGSPPSRQSYSPPHSYTPRFPPGSPPSRQSYTPPHTYTPTFPPPLWFIQPHPLPFQRPLTPHVV